MNILTFDLNLLRVLDVLLLGRDPAVALGVRHRYELTLPAAPPVEAFWSLTMYDVPEFYLVGNEIDRYAVGDRTPGLVTAEDGSFTLYLQADRPEEPEKAANWLPTPKQGPFRPIMRLYQPSAPILDGTFVLPPIRRV